MANTNFGPRNDANARAGELPGVEAGDIDVVFTINVMPEYDNEDNGRPEFDGTNSLDEESKDGDYKPGNEPSTTDFAMDDLVPCGRMRRPRTS